MPVERTIWLTLGQAHRAIRTAIPLAQAERAAQVGLSASDLNDMEHGRADPSPIVADLLKCFGVLLEAPR